MSAQVIAFPVQKPDSPSCFKCRHYDEPATRCQLFDEQIDSELYAARDCAGYETKEEQE